MYETRKRPGWGCQGIFSRRRRLIIMTMTWDRTAFLVLNKIRLYGLFCNAHLIFISPSSPFLATLSPHHP